jgi:hypothetical protein
LYGNDWQNPSQCNSTQSRWLGVCSTIPGIWRALQCIRRYADTRAKFPHLANFGKYVATILYYATLSMYRINQTPSMLAVFVVFATINSIYTCKFSLRVSFFNMLTKSAIWDIVMDWSLLQPRAKSAYLRDTCGYKSRWPYYCAMVIDPILRFNWLFYAIYTHDLRHASTVSFFVAFSECCRRGIWAAFRVENEHCSNVTSFKAFRDVPLPYPQSTTAPASTAVIEIPTEDNLPASPYADDTSPALRTQRTRTSSSAAVAEEGGIRRRRPRNLTSIIANAHTQDFQRKNPVDTIDREEGAEGNLSSKVSRTISQNRASSDENEDDDDDEDEDYHDAIQAAESRLESQTTRQRSLDA